MSENQPYKLRELVYNIPRMLPIVLGFGESESPLYFVLERKGSKEVRDYKPFLVAYTEVKNATYESAAVTGFLKLSKYFNIDNEGEIHSKGDPDQTRTPARIPIVTPVFQFGDDDSWKVALTLPSRYTLDKVPKPLESSIKIAEVPESVVGVIRTTGQLSEDKMQTKLFDLKHWLKNQTHFEPSASPYIAHQDLFLKINFLKKTELLIPLQTRR